MTFYDEMAQDARELIEEFGQGTCTLVPTTKAGGTGSRPQDFTRTKGTPVSIRAVVRTVSRDMINGVTIVGGEDMVLFSPTTTPPKLTDIITIDGREREIIGLKAIPGAGTVVVWKAVVAF